MASSARSTKPRPVPTRLFKHGDKGTPSQVTDITGRESVTKNHADELPGSQSIHPDMMKGLERSQAAFAAAEAATGLTPEELVTQRQREHEAYQNDVAARTREAYLGTTPPETNGGDKGIEHRSAPPVGATGLPERDVEGAELKPDMDGEETLTDARPVRRRARAQPRDDGKFSSHAKLAREREAREKVIADLRAELELKKEEAWFQALEAVGLTWFLKGFLGVIGVGFGGATVYYAIKQIGKMVGS